MLQSYQAGSCPRKGNETMKKVNVTISAKYKERKYLRGFVSVCKKHQITVKITGNDTEELINNIRKCADDHKENTRQNYNGATVTIKQVEVIDNITKFDVIKVEDLINSYNRIANGKLIIGASQ